MGTENDLKKPPPKALTQRRKRAKIRKAIHRAFDATARAATNSTNWHEGFSHWCEFGKFVANWKSLLQPQHWQ